MLGVIQKIKLFLGHLYAKNILNYNIILNLMTQLN
jgi:hypothetical protein